MNSSWFTLTGSQKRLLPLGLTVAKKQQTHRRMSFFWVVNHGNNACRQKMVLTYLQYVWILGLMIDKMSQNVWVPFRPVTRNNSNLNTKLDHTQNKKCLCWWTSICDHSVSPSQNQVPSCYTVVFEVMHQQFRQWSSGFFVGFWSCIMMLKRSHEYGDW